MERNEVKKLAIRMVKRDGWINLSRSGLCQAAGIANGSFPSVVGCTFAEFVKELQEGSESDIMNAPTVVTKKRANPEMRKEHILKAAVNLAMEAGYKSVTREGVANCAGISEGLVTRYFGTMNQLRTAIIRYAVKQEIVEIVAQGLAVSDPHAKKASTELKQKAIAHFNIM